MGIPKNIKSKPLADKTLKIKEAIEIAAKGNNEEATLNFNGKTIENSRLGRPPLAGDRTAKITFFMSQETKDRFEMAFLKEQLKRLEKQEKIQAIKDSVVKEPVVSIIPDLSTNKIESTPEDVVTEVKARSVFDILKKK